MKRHQQAATAESAEALSPLILHPFERDHFPLLIGWIRSEKELVQWGGTDLHFPLDEAQLTDMLAETQGSPPARLAYMAEQAGEWVAHGQLAFDWHNGVCRVSRILVAPMARRRHITRSLLPLLVDQAFSYRQIERLELNVFSFNIPALRAYARAGFVQEGTRRSAVKIGNERWDVVTMGLLRRERPSSANR